MHERIMANAFTARVAVVSFFLVISIVLGQAVMLKANPVEAAGYFMAGGNVINLWDLNSDLHRNAYPGVPYGNFSLGGGAHVKINKLVGSVEGHWLFQNEGKHPLFSYYSNDPGFSPTDTSHVTYLSGLCGFVNLGYVVYSSEELNVYPLLGLGGGILNLKVEETVDVVTDSAYTIHKKLSTTNFLLNLAVAADYSISDFLVFGLRVGYVFGPQKVSWNMKDKKEYEGEELEYNPPGTAFRGPYMRLMIGFKLK